MMFKHSSYFHTTLLMGMLIVLGLMLSQHIAAQAGSPGNITSSTARIDKPIGSTETSTVTATATRTHVIAWTPTNTPTPTLTVTPCPMNFSDVHPTDYFYEAVRYLYCEGAISGYDDGTFRPGNYTTRAQLCKIVV